MLPQLRQRFGIAGVNAAEEIFRLVLELIEVGVDGQLAGGHNEPPLIPGGGWRGARGGSKDPSRYFMRCSGGLSPVRGREAPCAPQAIILSRTRQAQVARSDRPV